MMLTGDSAETQVLAADEARYQALYARDIGALHGMLADDYLHTHATGMTDDKAGFLASIEAARYRFVLAERTAQKFRLAGAVALLSGKTRTTLDIAGQTKALNNAFVTVWMNDSGHWKLLHWQATMLPSA